MPTLIAYRHDYAEHYTATVKTDDGQEFTVVDMKETGDCRNIVCCHCSAPCEHTATVAAHSFGQALNAPRVYVVTEVIRYEVEATSEEEACEIICDASDRNDMLLEVSERYAVARWT